MKAVIDTSSWISLVRYYLPFDKDGKLFNFFRDKLASGEFIMIDEVEKECGYMAGGLVMQKLDFLSDKDYLKEHKPVRNTSTLVPPNPVKFFNQVEANFVIASQRRRLDDVQFENQKNQFLGSADAKLVIFCLDHLKQSPLDPIVLVTEESESANDGKLFQRIPTICRQLDITVKTLPQMLSEYAAEIGLVFQ